MYIMHVKWIRIISRKASVDCSVALPKITQAANNTAESLNHVCSHQEQCLFPFRKPCQGQFEITEVIRSIHCTVPPLLEAQLSLCS